MASFKYFIPEGASKQWSLDYHYSQAIDVGNGLVKVSGQGGWNTETGEFATDPQTEVELTLENIEKVLKAAGLRGWEDVYYVRSFHIDINTTLPLLGEGLKKRMPNHIPAATAVGVTQLAIPTMNLEVEVEAKRHDA